MELGHKDSYWNHLVHFTDEIFVTTVSWRALTFHKCHQLCTFFLYNTEKYNKLVLFINVSSAMYFFLYNTEKILQNSPFHKCFIIYVLFMSRVFGHHHQLPVSSSATVAGIHSISQLAQVKQFKLKCLIRHKHFTCSEMKLHKAW